MIRHSRVVCLRNRSTLLYLEPNNATLCFPLALLSDVAEGSPADPRLYCQPFSSILAGVTDNNRR